MKSPEPSAMAELPHLIDQLRRIGWRGPVPEPSMQLARVVAQHRASYVLDDGARSFGAQPMGAFLKRGLDPAARPAVGDFVRWKPGAPPQIVEVLPRRSQLVRAAAGERYERQLIATNVDYVLILTGLDADFNPARVERYLSLIEGSGAQPVVVLSKLDQAGAAAAAQIEALRQRLPAKVPLHAVNSLDPSTLTPLATYLQAGDSAVLVGSSGAGKSTLTNALLGSEAQATGTVRRQDGRGRHTTTHRVLLRLPSGGCLIDSPGMRELKLTGEEGLALFADIETLAAECRFVDCQHGSESGCAVREALDDGRLAPARWRHYLKLRDEREQQAQILEARLRQRRSSGVPRSRPPRRGWEE